MFTVSRLVCVSIVAMGGCVNAVFGRRVVTVVMTVARAMAISVVVTFARRTGGCVKFVRLMPVIVTVPATAGVMPHAAGFGAGQKAVVVGCRQVG